MNCTACKKPVDEHGEGRETDRCVAEKLGWTDVRIRIIGVYTMLDGFQDGKEKGSKACDHKETPYYSSPTMRAETWGLVERMKDDEDGFEIAYEKTLHKGPWCIHVGYMGIYAPTASLSICRAFLAQEENNGE